MVVCLAGKFTRAAPEVTAFEDSDSGVFLGPCVEKISCVVVAVVFE